MNVVVGADHAGLALKPRILAAIDDTGHTTIDVGAFEFDPDDDYPDYARDVGLAIVHGNGERGILVCGSGVGAAVAACKIPGVRASVAHDTFSARQGVEDDDVNVISLGARVVGPELAAEIVTAFLEASFSGAERHVRRLGKIETIEREAKDGAFDP